ncbi:MAG: hypothetical protein U9R38_03075, partial [Candidatus Margulisiibacteriota bacterium]|nr:hypothetical protein [Candidatus Margulisiibacteriota bacterium]
MQWNFGEIIDYISDIISPGVSLSTAHTAMVKNLINVSISDVAVDFPINDLKVPDQYVRTVADYSDETLTATDGSKTLTGDSTVWTYKMIGRKIRIDDGDAYYIIDDVPSATEITLDRFYNGDGGAALEYNIFENSYDIPTVIGATGWVKNIIDPSQTGNPAEEENWDWIEAQDPTLQHTGTVERFALIGNK